MPMYVPGLGSCTSCGKPNADNFADPHLELEFSMWGTCQKCQLQKFPALGSGLLDQPMPRVVVVQQRGPFSELSPLASVPVAFPDRQAVWSSPYHLFIALHFVEPRW